MAHTTVRRVTRFNFANEFTSFRGVSDTSVSCCASHGLKSLWLTQSNVVMHDL